MLWGAAPFYRSIGGSGNLSAGTSVFTLYPGHIREVAVNSMREIYGNRRLWIVLLLLCVTVLAQSTALSAESESHHAADHCCLLCHVGPLPFLQTSVAATLAPVFQVVWPAPPVRVERPSDVLVVPRASRAPPSV